MKQNLVETEQWHCTVNKLHKNVNVLCNSMDVNRTAWNIFFVIFVISMYL